MSVNTTAIFCCLDGFAKIYQEWLLQARRGLIPCGKRRHRAGKLVNAGVKMHQTPEQICTTFGVAEGCP